MAIAQSDENGYFSHRAKAGQFNTSNPETQHATTDANPPLNATHACPLCDATLLPDKPDGCPKCDWVRDADQHHGTGRDMTAVCFSVLPGFGHIYKGHRLLGAILMLGSVFAVFAALLAGFASAGWGLLLLPLYWGAVMLHVYWADDRALHHHTRG